MSTGIWPRSQPRPTDSHAEQRVYDALKRQLPSGWSAWHSLRIRTKQAVEGEGDFVLAIPERGFLVLEVKGGQMEMRDGRWHQNGQPLERAPREQAQSFARHLNDRLKELGCPSVPYGVLTLFPDTAFSGDPPQDNLRDLILGEQDLPWLIESIRSKLDQVFPENFLIPKCNWSALLHQLWGETWVAKLKLGHKARVDAEDRLKLDREQMGLIDSLIANRLLLVEGIAGSGKTILAREAALRMAAEGWRVLYFCYTDALAQWLRPTLEDAGVEVSTVPRYAVALLKQADCIEENSAVSDFWAQVSLRAAADALPHETNLPDVVIVDEAQDLTDSDWVLVEELARDRICWIFHDPAQGFWQERTLPDWTGAQARFRLSTCYRCPPPVLELSRMLRGEPHDEKLLDHGRSAGTVQMIVAPSETAVSTKLENEINKLRSEGFAPGDIAVISLRGQTAPGGIARCEQIGSIPVVRADSPEMEDHVIADTFLRFKGLERPVIIVTDLRLVKDRADVRMHIALTRATDVVRVVGVISSFGVKNGF